MSQEWDNPNRWESNTAFCPACGSADSTWRNTKANYGGEEEYLDHLCSLCGCQFGFVAAVAPEPISPKGYIDKLRALMAALRLKSRSAG